MTGHYNLYYIYLEEKQKNPMPDQRVLQMQKNIENFYKKIKPPRQEKPPNIIQEKNNTKKENIYHEKNDDFGNDPDDPDHRAAVHRLR